MNIMYPTSHRDTLDVYRTNYLKSYPLGLRHCFVASPSAGKRLGRRLFSSKAEYTQYVLADYDPTGRHRPADFARRVDRRVAEERAALSLELVHTIRRAALGEVTLGLPFDEDAYLSVTALRSVKRKRAPDVIYFNYQEHELGYGQPTFKRRTQIGRDRLVSDTQVVNIADWSVYVRIPEPIDGKDDTQRKLRIAGDVTRSNLSSPMPADTPTLASTSYVTPRCASQLLHKRVKHIRDELCGTLPSFLLEKPPTFPLTPLTIRCTDGRIPDPPSTPRMPLQPYGIQWRPPSYRLNSPLYAGTRPASSIKKMKGSRIVLSPDVFGPVKVVKLCAVSEERDTGKNEKGEKQERTGKTSDKENAKPTGQKNQAKTEIKTIGDRKESDNEGVSTPANSKVPVRLSNTEESESPSSLTLRGSSATHDADDESSHAIVSIADSCTSLRSEEEERSLAGELSSSPLMSPMKRMSPSFYRPLRPEASGNRTEAAAVGEPGSAPAATIYPGSHPLSSIEAGTGPLSIIQTTQGLHQCRPLSSETDAPLRDASLRESAVRHSMTSQRCTPVPSHELAVPTASSPVNGPAKDEDISPPAPITAREVIPLDGYERLFAPISSGQFDDAVEIEDVKDSAPSVTTQPSRTAQSSATAEDFATTLAGGSSMSCNESLFAATSPGQFDDAVRDSAVEIETTATTLARSTTPVSSPTANQECLNVSVFFGRLNDATKGRDVETPEESGLTVAVSSPSYELDGAMKEGDTAGHDSSLPLSHKSDELGREISDVRNDMDVATVVTTRDISAPSVEVSDLFATAGVEETMILEPCVNDCLMSVPADSSITLPVERNLSPSGPAVSFVLGTPTPVLRPVECLSPRPIPFASTTAIPEVQRIPNPSTIAVGNLPSADTAAAVADANACQTLMLIDDVDADIVNLTTVESEPMATNSVLEVAIPPLGPEYRPSTSDSGAPAKMDMVCHPTEDEDGPMDVEMITPASSLMDIDQVPVASVLMDIDEDQAPPTVTPAAVVELVAQQPVDHQSAVQHSVVSGPILHELPVVSENIDQDEVLGDEDDLFGDGQVLSNEDEPMFQDNAEHIGVADHGNDWSPETLTGSDKLDVDQDMLAEAERFLADIGISLGVTAVLDDRRMEHRPMGLMDDDVTMVDSIGLDVLNQVKQKTTLPPAEDTLRNLAGGYDPSHDTPLALPDEPACPVPLLPRPPPSNSRPSTPPPPPWSPIPSSSPSPPSQPPVPTSPCVPASPDWNALFGDDEEKTPDESEIAPPAMPAAASVDDDLDSLFGPEPPEPSPDTVSCIKSSDSLMETDSPSTDLPSNQQACEPLTYRQQQWDEMSGVEEQGQSTENPDVDMNAAPDTTPWNWSSHGDSSLTPFGKLVGEFQEFIGDDCMTVLDAVPDVTSHNSRSTSQDRSAPASEFPPPTRMGDDFFSPRSSDKVVQGTRVGPQRTKRRTRHGAPYSSYAKQRKDGALEAITAIVNTPSMAMGCSVDVGVADTPCPKQVRDKAAEKEKVQRRRQLRRERKRKQKEDKENAKQMTGIKIRFNPRGKTAEQKLQIISPYSPPDDGSLDGLLYALMASNLNTSPTPSTDITDDLLKSMASLGVSNDSLPAGSGARHALSNRSSTCTDRGIFALFGLPCVPRSRPR
ncbi:hypothetical protein AcW1_007724 [Taiwanofungus camphoratus]|nr:hypothetical protein AcW1_007724 [Antrodia cinnamomea]